jgi:magnesium-transporting ATPase (P-type)
VRRYAGDRTAGWYQLDTLQRELERLVAALDDEFTLAHLLQRARAAYLATAGLLADRFLVAIEREGFAFPGVAMQTDTYAKHVAPLLDRPLLVRTLVVSIALTAVALGLFEAARSADLSTAEAQTTAVTGAVLLQALYLITCRSLTRPNRELGHWSNPSVYAGIGIVLALQALFVFAPFMQTVFGSAALGVRELVWAAAASTVVLPVTWLEERWRVARSRTS